MHHVESYALTTCVSCSINGDGAAEPVLDNMNEGDDENGAEEYSSSWPATFINRPDVEESDDPKQVAQLFDSQHF